MKHRLTFDEKEQKLKLAGLNGTAAPNRFLENQEDLPSVNDRVRKIFDITCRSRRKPTDMLFFVMYDIADNRVRTLIAKYLVRKGCIRIQRSIFLASRPFPVYEQIRSDLAEVQAAYDNEDSILVVPVSESNINSMGIIGKNLDLDVIMNIRNTLFF